MTERRVDMLRVEREEEVYDREEVLGRDVRSVFPTRAKDTAESGGGGMDAEAVREMLGGRKFVTESELEKIKSQRGESADDGTTAPMKPLAEVLREAKEAKEQAFADKWKQMKTGKNRPLDADELSFYESLADQERATYLQQKQAEAAELAEFKRALAEEAARKEADAAVLSTGGVDAAKPTVKPEIKKPFASSIKPVIKPVIKPIVKIVPKGGAAGQHGTSSSQQAGNVRRIEEPGSTEEEGQAAKRHKASKGVQGEEQEEEGGGLLGLLGGYGSDDDTS